MKTVFGINLLSPTAFVKFNVGNFAVGKCGITLKCGLSSTRNVIGYVIGICNINCIDVMFSVTCFGNVNLSNVGSAVFGGCPTCKVFACNTCANTVDYVITTCNYAFGNFGFSAIVVIDNLGSCAIYCIKVNLAKSVCSGHLNGRYNVKTVSSGGPTLEF